MNRLQKSDGYTLAITRIVGVVVIIITVVVVVIVVVAKVEGILSPGYYRNCFLHSEWSSEHSAI